MGSVAQLKLTVDLEGEKLYNLTIEILSKLEVTIMTEEEIRKRVASPQALAMVLKSLQRSKRLREEAPSWLRKLAERDGSNGWSMVSNHAEGKNRNRSPIDQVA